MKCSKLFTFSVLISTVLAERDLSERISDALNLLLSEGPSFNVLNEFGVLISDIEKSGTILNSTLAQVYYKKALVAIGINKNSEASQDLLTATGLDPAFSPASDKLVQMWVKNGQFSDIRAKFTQEQYPSVFQKMGEWENTFSRITSTLAAGGEIDQSAAEEFSAAIADKLIAVTPDSADGYELKIKLAKYEAARGKQISFDDLARDYSKVTRFRGGRDLSKYATYSQFLLFTQGKFNDAWSTAKACLRIDNDSMECGKLSKVFSKLQSVLKAYEEYYMMDEYLYPQGDGENAVLPDEKVGISFDASLYGQLASPIKLSKKDMASLPADVHTVLDFLQNLATEFCLSEFPGIHPGTLPFVKVLNKFACELSIDAKSPDKKKMCDLVIEDKMFLPKHLAKIDSLLSKKKYTEAKAILNKFGGNVKKTDKFQKRYIVIQEAEERAERKRQQEHFRQQQRRQEQFRQQQHQQQQQQQQQSHFDRSKDYYKILEVAKDADEKTIKKAYRTQTLKYHPDKYKGGDLDEAAIEAKMQDINEAYEVLSNPSSKSDYDNGGSQQHRGQGRGGQFHQQHYAENVQFDMNDFMRQFMRNGF